MITTLHVPTRAKPRCLNRFTTCHERSRRKKRIMVKLNLRAESAQHFATCTGPKTTGTEPSEKLEKSTFRLFRADAGAEALLCHTRSWCSMYAILSSRYIAVLSHSSRILHQQQRNHIRIAVVPRIILQEQQAGCNPSVTGDFSLALRRLRNPDRDVHAGLYVKVSPVIFPLPCAD